MTHLLILVLALAGFALLSRAMKHQRGARKAPIAPLASVLLRLLGSAALAGALALALITARDVGVVEWIGSLALAGVAFIVLRPSR